MEFINFNENRLSRFALGTVQFGLPYGIANNSNKKPTQQEIDKILKYVTSNGINLFDTAISYGNSHQTINKFSKKEDIFVVSKIDSKTLLNNGIIATNRALNELLAKSLFALLLHDTKLLYNWNDKAFWIVKNLKEKYKIRYFGVSIYSDEEFSLAIDNNSIDIIQVPFNIFDHRAIKLNWFKLAKEKNKLIIVRSIYLQGLLFLNSHQILSKLAKAKIYIDILDKLCNQYGLNRLELIFGFVNFFTSQCVVLFGAQNLNEAKENIDIFKRQNIINKIDIDNILDKFKNITKDIYDPTCWML